MSELEKCLGFSDFNPMNINSIDQKLRTYCVFCGKQGTKIFMHHFPLPRWLGGEEVVPICHGCHTRFEAYFINFIKYGQFKAKTWSDPENAKRFSKNWDFKNRERLHIIRAERARLEYWKNPDKYRVKARNQFLKDPEKNREKQKIWYKNNPDKVKERRKANRAYYAEWQKQNRLKKKSQREGTL